MDSTVKLSAQLCSYADYRRYTAEHSRREVVIIALRLTVPAISIRGVQITTNSEGIVVGRLTRTRYFILSNTRVGARVLFSHDLTTTFAGVVSERVAKVSMWTSLSSRGNGSRGQYGPTVEPPAMAIRFSQMTAAWPESICFAAASLPTKIERDAAEGSPATRVEDQRDSSHIEAMWKG